LWITVTEIAFKRRFDLLMEEDGTKRTGNDALLAGDALFAVDIIDAILCRDGSGRAVLHALGYLALPADNRHSYDRMGIDHHDPNCALLGVVHSKTMNGTNQFADLASGTSLGDHR
jgi:hypothetical protein